jgi:hypothetical protein
MERLTKSSKEGLIFSQESITRFSSTNVLLFFVIFIFHFKKNAAPELIEGRHLKL